jgi:hypothetical protein
MEGSKSLLDIIYIAFYQNPVASYAYDYLGRRISRTIYGSPGGAIKYAYDGD